MSDKIYFSYSVLACNFCIEIKLYMCASFRVFFPKFLKDKLSPWPVFLKGQFQLQCRIGPMVWPGSNPALGDVNFLPS